MTVALFSNFINHHQVSFADELYELLEGNFSFVEMIPMPIWLKNSGYPDFTTRSYVIQAWKNHENLILAESLVNTVDILLIASNESLKYEILRSKFTDKITIEISERWFKKGMINLFSPRLIIWLFYYHTLFRKKNVYKLCAGAYTSYDMKLLHAFNGRCFKWGYFTYVNDWDLRQHNENKIIKIMWCARFISWKHPELVIKLAANLKKAGYNFIINMYGSGEKFDTILSLVNNLHLNDVINLRGNLPNHLIHNAMREHQIFLFTSDRNEGWGAVANEALSNGCVLVGSDKIGSIPFLIKDGVNGCVFKSGNLNSLTEKTKWLIDNPDIRKSIAKSGYNTIKIHWSPKNAARNLLLLINDLKSMKGTSITEGPCSNVSTI